MRICYFSLFYVPIYMFYCFLSLKGLTDTTKLHAVNTWLKARNHWTDFMKSAVNCCFSNQTMWCVFSSSTAWNGTWMCPCMSQGSSYLSIFCLQQTLWGFFYSRKMVSEAWCQFICRPGTENCFPSEMKIRSSCDREIAVVRIQGEVFEYFMPYFTQLFILNHGGYTVYRF